MSFPETRHTLIQRLAGQGTESEWREFLTDYWMPVCRFARYHGHLQIEDAEDVASQTFEAVLKNQLLARWTESKTAKLRTLLCSVARNVLSNRARVATGRARLLTDRAAHPDPGAGLMAVALDGADPADADNADLFYAAWVEEILRQTVEGLLKDYNERGKGDYFRVFYGRLCEEMAMQDIAAALQLRASTVTSYYQHARDRLGEKLRDTVRAHVQRYAPTETAAEFEAEWQRLGEYLSQHGGLEQTIRLAYQGFDAQERDTARARIAAKSAILLRKNQG